VSFLGSGVNEWGQLRAKIKIGGRKKPARTDPGGQKNSGGAGGIQNLKGQISETNQGNKMRAAYEWRKKNHRTKLSKRGGIEEIER